MEENKLKNILAHAGRVITDESKEVEVTVNPSNWLHKLLIKKGFLKSKRVIEIKPILVGNRLRVSTKSLTIPHILFTGKNADTPEVEMMQAIHDHTETLIYVVAVCIQNNKNEPSERLLEKLRWVNDKEFFNLLDASLSMSGIADFMKSIILIKGQNVIHASGLDAMHVDRPE